ncbi:MAG TPA: hypothetical protein DCY13_23830 [Verrucomicrobiales bacterium]|nr:hypothetical protein [Verrucomicrobiales bacterium]
MRAILTTLFVLCLTSTNRQLIADPVSVPPTTLMLVVGAPGEDEYQPIFEESAAAWAGAAKLAGAKSVKIGADEVDGNPPRIQLESALKSATNSPADLWLVFVGHGTYDGRDAKFNLHGPDVSASELSTWLEPLNRRVVIFQGASASAPFINRLSNSGRIIITATRSGNEQNYARFGRHAAEALVSPQTDIDQDGQNSALEIFLAAARLTADWYKNEGRLATEHPLIDDNGDARGTPADWFQGLRVVKRAGDGSQPDGLRARQVHLVPSADEARLTVEQRQWRDGKELELSRLRDRRTAMSEEEYFGALEELLLELARFYAAVEAGTNPVPAGNPATN